MNAQARRTGVIWVTGYSAAGKTTVGRKVELRLVQRGIPTIFLDGDDLRGIFDNRWGYSREERIDLAKVYFRLCSHLSSQGFVVVIAAVAMYDEIRQWVRQNVSNLVEAYLEVPDPVRRERDGRTKRIYGADTRLEELYDAPKQADVVIANHAQVTPDQAADRIVACFLDDVGPRPSDKGRQAHWARYYLGAQAPVQESSFAAYVVGRLGRACRILEVGCGNGRDAMFFARLGHHVTAIDSSAAAIEACRLRADPGAASFLHGTLSELEAGLESGFDAVYSRFCLHAMTSDEEAAFLDSAARLLVSGGRLLIECRSINDPLARKGEVLSPTERIFGHYRRFVVFDELMQSLRASGFDVVEGHESSGLAKLGDDDPVVIRVLAARR